MTVTVYKSTDASAPYLRGNVQDPNTQGSLGYLLNACLVTGYGAKPAAGWTRPYTGTNVSVFKQGTGSNGFYVQVDETLATPWVKLRGYRTMSSATVGTNPFPTTTQATDGVYHPRSNGFTATNREWYVIATAEAFYLLVNTNTNITPIRQWPQNVGCFFFGDIEALTPGDSTATAIAGHITTSVGDTWWNTQQTQVVGATTWYSANRGMYLAGPNQQMGVTLHRSGDTSIRWIQSAQQGSQYAGDVGGQRTFGNNTSLSAPSAPGHSDNGIYLTKIAVHEGYIQKINSTTGDYYRSGILRGYLPGILILLGKYIDASYQYMSSIADELVVTNVVNRVGRTYEVKNIQGTSGPGIVLFETSNTW